MKILVFLGLCLNFLSFVQVLPSGLVTIFHGKTDFAVISYLSYFYPHFVTSFEPRVLRRLKPLTADSDLTDMDKAFASSPLVKCNKKAKVKNILNFAAENLPNFECSVSGPTSASSLVSFPISFSAVLSPAFAIPAI